MTAGDGRTMQYHLNRLAGTLNEFDVPRYDAQGALNKLAGTTGLGENEAAARIV